MQMDAYMAVEYMCQTCGEHFDAGEPIGQNVTPPECPSCGSRDVEREEPAGASRKLASPYDRGICPCAVLALTDDPQHRR